MRDSTGRLVAKTEEQIGSTMPSFCKKIVNHEFFRSSRRTHRMIWLLSKDCKSRSFILTQFSTPSTFSCWKIRFKTKVSSCSGFPSEAMLWIKEVEIITSVDDLKSSRSIQGYTHFPNFKMLDARMASALNKIIQNSYFKKKVSPEEQKAQKEDRFLRGRQIAYMIVSGAHDTVLDFSDLFSITLRNDNVQEFDTRWDEILLSMTKIPSDDILGSLYKLRKRESDQLKTVLELYDMEIHQKISRPDYQKLNTMVKRSTDHKLRLRNFDARNERIGTGAVVTSRRRSSGVESLLSMESIRAVFERFPARRMRAKPTPKTTPPSEPPTQRGRSASRKKKVRGCCPSGQFGRQPCKTSCNVLHQITL